MNPPRPCTTIQASWDEEMGPLSTHRSVAQVPEMSPRQPAGISLYVQPPPTNPDTSSQTVGQGTHVAEVPGFWLLLVGP